MENDLLEADCLPSVSKRNIRAALNTPRSCGVEVHSVELQEKL